MLLVVICRVVDNLGDAGFSLRLARALCLKGHPVHLLCDEPTTLQRLLPNPSSSSLPEGLSVHAIEDDSDLSAYLALNPAPEAVLECFGSSTSESSPICNTALQTQWPNTQWLVIDYLSAEPWIEEFHGLASINPSTGFSSRFVYPGFTARTGGLIHCDWPHGVIPSQCTGLAANEQSTLTQGQSVFVFSYPQAPTSSLIEALLPTQTLFSPIPSQFEPVRSVPFCPLNEFDQTLQTYDWLFVRGEDSFVRAQLSARPMVWQIYPTADGAHARKLEAFFERYADTLPPEIRDPLFAVWWGWNGLVEPTALKEAWRSLAPRYSDLLAHAQRWADKLRAGPELVSEILTLLGHKNLNR